MSEWNEEWNAHFHNIKNGRKWCPYCIDNKSCTLEDSKRIAHIKNSKHLSKKYVNTGSVLLWRCNESHEWNANPNSVKDKNTWCQ
ncbi:hypothetical protein Glove_186g179 [Diversispora epigaea]|uniref:Zinc-ribbon domain-containing protein n=1 Tax=Diversispora epigaea TaxID=1348612 RepID=A0A397IWR2_9GLOM|nr:hypothetical protein Glove_186g179 [Diversispora epigaea]